MKPERSLDFAPAMLLFASFLRLTTAQTATLDIPTGLPASCTPLATLLSEYPPPTDGEAVDDALNNGIDAFYTHYQATATAKPTASLDRASLCDYIISTAIPSASPSVIPALSSYISAAGIWLNDHGLDEAKSLLDGDCTRVVQDDDQLAVGALDFVIAFGPCYELLGWDERETANSSASTSATTTEASSAPATTTPSGSSSVQATTSPTTSQSSETDTSPPSSGSNRVADAFWILSATAGAIFLITL
ncbi:hypothetical protein GGR51DRAFT_516842 [Nemania sp. FL0031]|nr:hypothetical protein GGR51DRAFT_516842 [Nemania sp. FL0031]